MQFVLEIDMKGSAFADPDSELARILRGLANVTQCRATFDLEGKVRDDNGNTCGAWKIYEGEMS